MAFQKYMIYPRKNDSSLLKASILLAFVFFCPQKQIHNFLTPLCENPQSIFTSQFIKKADIHLIESSAFLNLTNLRHAKTGRPVPCIWPIIGHKIAARASSAPF